MPITFKELNLDLRNPGSEKDLDPNRSEINLYISRIIKEKGD